ncbi:MmcQ-like protein [Brumimicrobium salinarum]|uniref:MmcQ-like protein n=1 Tax=Brumimicrobium salinarum TaxID=2058658 RepID=A0A2I0R3U8_9FLAO|nr:MmcQ/YjbR family DNA-binding protein [Brumimicrobium salinarum]PKR81247.1 MmcQ-like protein [Brumimicrobium salinarum]
MNTEVFRNHCLQKKHTEEGFPFDETTLVFKLKGKIFALLSLKEDSRTCNLKCDPEKAIALREKFKGVVPGYHMNKKHWNTISFDEDVSDELILELIDHSYNLIHTSFSKKIQKELSL